MRIEKCIEFLRGFAGNRGGNFAAGFALLVPLLLGLAGGGVDLIAYQRNMQKMQNAADAAVLAATREAALQGWNEQIAAEIVDKFLAENLGMAGGADPQGEARMVAMTSAAGGTFQASTTVDMNAKSVAVTVTMDYYPYFFLGYFRNSPQIAVSSKASVASQMNICVIGLDSAASSTIKLSGQSKITAPSCAIFSNSVATNGFESVDDALLTSDYNCSAGGVTGAAKNFSTQPTTDCKPVDDPLAARGIPAAASCNFTNKVVSNFISVLNPGVYCGGITINKNANVVFKPGTYVIKDGELKSNLGGISFGKGVTFVFTGEGSRFSFDPSTYISFEAPETGAYAGILFYQDPKMVNTLTYEISSKKAGKLLGTIYLPNGIFKVHAVNPVGEESAYTVIVARKLDIGASADLVINADYASTKVPVPSGLGPVKNMHLTN